YLHWGLHRTMRNCGSKPDMVMNEFAPTAEALAQGALSLSGSTNSAVSSDFGWTENAFSEPICWRPIGTRITNLPDPSKKGPFYRVSVQSICSLYQPKKLLCAGDGIGHCVLSVHDDRPRWHSHPDR